MQTVYKIQGDSSMNNDLISVIVPAYNAENTISRLVEAVLSQTYTKFEMIIVNDGSSDHTRKVVSKFKDVRIKYLEKKRGEG